MRGRPRRVTVESGDSVVIAYEGPRGGPGMRVKMLGVTSVIVGAGLGASVSLDNRRPLFRRVLWSRHGWARLTRRLPPVAL